MIATVSPPYSVVLFSPAVLVTVESRNPVLTVACRPVSGVV